VWDSQLDGLNFWAYVENWSDDSTLKPCEPRDVRITASAGDFAYAEVGLSQTNSRSAASVSVGDLAIGDVSIAAGQSAYASVELYNWAYNTGTGTATAGNLTIGDVTVDVGVSGEASLSISNWAEVWPDAGAATWAT